MREKLEFPGPTRREFMGWAAVGGATLAVPGALIGCSSASSGGSASGPRKGGNLIVTQTDNPTTLDPQDTNDNLSLTIEKTMYERLIDFDPKMRLIPGLATKWSASPDATQFTFQLRKGVTFHDGTPFNGAAVKATFDRVRNQANALRRWSLYSNIEEIIVESDYQVRFRLSQPFGAFFNNVAHPAGGIISPKAIATYGKDLSHHPVGTGPFQFVDWRLAQDVTVRRNEAYWDRNSIHLDQITFKPIPEAQTTLDMLEADQAQFVYPIPAASFASVGASGKARVSDGPSIYVNGMGMNNTHPPFNDPRVRQALNLAVDKQALIKVVSYGHARELDAPMAPGVPGHVTAGAPYKHDVKKAADLLAAAGYQDGFQFTLWLTAAGATLGQFLQQQLQTVKVTANLQTYEGPTLTNLEYQPQNVNKLQAVVSGWSPSTGDADWALRPLFAKDSWPPTLFNTAFYENSHVDSDLQGGLQTANWSDREKLYADAQRRIWADCPWVFLHCQDVLSATSTHIGGVYVLPDQTQVVSRGYFKGTQSNSSTNY